MRQEIYNDTDQELLLHARLWAGLLGEQDVLGWWRTTQVLGPSGACVGKRAFPQTHRTAPAHLVFATARHACIERYPEPSAETLFNLGSETEDRFDAYLVDQLNNTELWDEPAAVLEALSGAVNAQDVLLEAGVISGKQLDEVAPIPAGAGGRSLPIGGASDFADTIRTLAAAFTRSTRRDLMVPYLANAG